MKITEVLLRGTAGSFAVKAGGAGMALIVHLQLARWMGADEYGLYVYVWAWATIGVMAASFGFPTSSVRFVAEYIGSQDWRRLKGFWRVRATVVSATSIVVAAVLLLGAWALVGPDSESMLLTFIVASVALPFFAQAQVGGGELQGLRRVVHGQWPLHILHPLLVLLGFLAITRTGLGGPTAIWAMVATLGASIVGVLVTWLLLTAYRPRQTKSVRPVSEPQHWLRTSLSMLLIAGFNLLIQRIDTLMIGSIVGIAEAGIYAVATKIAGLQIFVLVAVNAIVAPMVAEFHFKEQTDALKQTLQLSAQLAFGGSCAVAAALAFVYRDLLELFGSEFIAAAPALWILVAGQLANAFAGPAYAVLNMTGHQGDSANILGWSMGANIVLNAVLVPQFGMEGGAVATALTLVGWTIFSLRAVRKRLGLSVTAFSLSRG